MDYYGLRSIISVQKQKVLANEKSDSFFTITDKDPKYFEPKFPEIERFPVEMPSIILIFAVGASGNTTAAQALFPLIQACSFSTWQNPVGDNTLSGIVMDYYLDEISAPPRQSRGLEFVSHSSRSVVS